MSDKKFAFPGSVEGIYQLDKPSFIHFFHHLSPNLQDAPQPLSSLQKQGAALILQYPEGSHSSSLNFFGFHCFHHPPPKL